MCAQVKLISSHPANSDVLVQADLVGATVKNEEVVVAIVVVV